MKIQNFRWQDGWPSRAVAVATTAYSVAITIRPEILAKPCRLTNPDGSVPPAVAELTRSIGTRDAAMAAALAVARAYPMNVLTAARVLSDGADAAWFARVVPPGSGPRSPGSRRAGPRWNCWPPSLVTAARNDF